MPIKINLKSVKAKLRGLQEEMQTNTLEGVKEAAKKLLELSRPLVPVDSGALKKSGRIAIVKRKNHTSYEVIYSQADKENGYNYAAIQHEDLSFKHLNGGQAKYLEQPMRENKELLMGIIASKIKEKTKGKR